MMDVSPVAALADAAALSTILSDAVPCPPIASTDPSEDDHLVGLVRQAEHDVLDCELGKLGVYKTHLVATNTARKHRVAAMLAEIRALHEQLEIFRTKSPWTATVPPPTNTSTTAAAACTDPYGSVALGSIWTEVRSGTPDAYSEVVHRLQHTLAAFGERARSARAQTH